jgi:hypothetical protein
VKDVMIDFETFGNGTDACIVQVGAVYFDPETGQLGDEFKFNISDGSIGPGAGKIDEGTVRWWLGQSDEARQSILKPGGSLSDVMRKFNSFLAGAERIWSHATFDFPILQATLKRLGIRQSFKYSAGLDLRTLSYLSGIPILDFKREGTHHDALDDAKHQARYAIEAIRFINGALVEGC